MGLRPGGGGRGALEVTFAAPVVAFVTGPEPGAVAGTLPRLQAEFFVLKQQPCRAAGLHRFEIHGQDRLNG